MTTTRQRSWRKFSCHCECFWCSFFDYHGEVTGVSVDFSYHDQCIVMTSVSAVMMTVRSKRQQQWQDINHGGGGSVRSSLETSSRKQFQFRCWRIITNINKGTISVSAVAHGTSLNTNISRETNSVSVMTYSILHEPHRQHEQGQTIRKHDQRQE